MSLPREKTKALEGTGVGYFTHSWMRALQKKLKNDDCGTEVKLHFASRMGPLFSILQSLIFTAIDIAQFATASHKLVR
jgi:hypothetical protein